MSLAEGLPADACDKAPVATAPLTHHVLVCTGTACAANGSQATFDALRAALKTKGLLYGKHGSMTGQVLLGTCGSMGFCAVGPAVLVYPQGHWYQGVNTEDVDALVAHYWGEGLASDHPLLTEKLARQGFG
jgi:(2Fe-2S) ferredoxin